MGRLLAASLAKELDLMPLKLASPYHRIDQPVSRAASHVSVCKTLRLPS